MDVGGMQSTVTNGPGYQPNLTVVLPFHPDTKVTKTTEQGVYRPPTGGDSGGVHAGTDLAVPAGTPVVFYMSGTVTKAGWYDGYGYTVDIRGADGMTHRFAHLDPAIPVREGDKVSGGETIGKVGSVAHVGPNGNHEMWTGPHLDWEVRTGPGFGVDGTRNPILYMAETGGKDSVTPDPRGDTSGHNAPNPGQSGPRIPNGAVMLPQGYYAYNGMVYRVQEPDSNGTPASQQYSNSRPMSTGYSGRGRNGIVYDTNNNYGYSWLAHDPAWRNEIVRVARKHGIDPQWLADTIDSECSGDPQNGNSSGYGGIIGFGSNDVPLFGGLSLAQVEALSGAAQMKYVDAYLSQYKDSDLQKGFAYVKGAVWGNGGLVAALNSGNRQRILAANNDPGSKGESVYTVSHRYNQRFNRNYAVPGSNPGEV